MSDKKLDRAIARGNPFDDESVAALPLADLEADLVEDLMTTPTLTPVVDPAPTPRRGRRRAVLAVAAGIVAVLLGGLLLPGDRGPSAPARVYAAEVRAAAEANPRLLLDAPGWSITYVTGFGAAEGEMTFKNGSDELDVHWRPTADYRQKLKSRAHGNIAKPITLLGKNGTMFWYVPHLKWSTILPPEGRNFLEIVGKVGSEQAYRDLIGKLRQVDVDTWLDAMPDWVVKPDERMRAIKEMLADIPVPPGFDIGTLDDKATSSRYQLGARVTGRITCAWIERWVDAKRRGDTAALREAADALRSSRNWNILIEIKDQGGWSEGAWYMAESTANGVPPGGWQQSCE